MNSHFPLPKFAIGDELTLSLAKNSHFSFLPSHFPSLPSRRGLPLWRWKSQWVHTFHCQNLLKIAMSSHFPLPKSAENRNEFTLSIAKIFFAVFVPPLSNGTSRATSGRKPKTNDQILPSPILTFLFFPSKKWSKLIPKTIWNRKRDCAWGTIGERERETEVMRRRLEFWSCDGKACWTP